MPNEVEIVKIIQIKTHTLLKYTNLAHIVIFSSLKSVDLESKSGS